MQQFVTKDFISTAEDLVFAVVDPVVEEDRVLCFLRYVREGEGWRKLDTAAANALLTAGYPQYLYYSALKDTYLHGVSIAAIAHHHRPVERLQDLLHRSDPDPVQEDLRALCRMFEDAGLPLTQFGVTGSLLIGAQHADSDLDLVVYNRDFFHSARSTMRQLLDAGALQNLDDVTWQETFARRGCSTLSLEEYTWHEQRKYNKACINGRKFDLSFVSDIAPEPHPAYRKLGPIEVTVRVKDARYAFDYPAMLLLEHPEIDACVSYTATYIGQAENGEWVNVCGQLEEAADGTRRIVIGSSREAHDEYIKVVQDDA